MDGASARPVQKALAGQALIRRLPQRCFGQPEDPDGPLLLLVSDLGRFMTGADIAVDGGHLVSSLQGKIMNFTICARTEDFRQRIARFVTEEIPPVEADRSTWDAHGNIGRPARDTLRKAAKSEGLWCLRLKPGTGGQEPRKTGMAVCNEEMNRSICGPVVFDPAAPGDGTMMALEQGSFARKAVSMAKIHVANLLHKAADTAIQINGARGYSTDKVLEWIYRYARQARLVDGADEAHQMALNRHLTGEGRDFWKSDALKA